MWGGGYKKPNNLTFPQRLLKRFRALPKPLKIILKIPYYPIRYLRHKIRFLLLDYEVRKFLSHKQSTPINKDEPYVIVSLSSYPERFYQLHYTLYSICRQTYKPHKIILNLTKEECPNLLDDVPNNILLFREHGLEISFSKQNFRSYNKIIHTLQNYKDSIIITCDDDHTYPPDLIENLVQSYKKFPQDIHCHNVSKATFSPENKLNDFLQWKGGYTDFLHGDSLLPHASYLNSPLGFSGVLYPPNSLHKDVLDSEKFLSLAPTNDDLWLWVMALLQGTKIRLIENWNKNYHITLWSSQGKQSLWRHNTNGGYLRDYHNLLRAYPEIITITSQAHKQEGDLGFNNARS